MKACNSVGCDKDARFSMKLSRVYPFHTATREYYDGIYCAKHAVEQCKFLVGMLELIQEEEEEEKEGEVIEQ